MNNSIGMLLKKIQNSLIQYIKINMISWNFCSSFVQMKWKDNWNHIFIRSRASMFTSSKKPQIFYKFSLFSLQKIFCCLEFQCFSGVFVIVKKITNFSFFSLQHFFLFFLLSANSTPCVMFQMQCFQYHGT